MKFSRKTYTWLPVTRILAFDLASNLSIQRYHVTANNKIAQDYPYFKTFFIKIMFKFKNIPRFRALLLHPAVCIVSNLAYSTPQIVKLQELSKIPNALSHCIHPNISIYRYLSLEQKKIRHSVRIFFLYFNLVFKPEFLLYILVQFQNSRRQILLKLCNSSICC